jgi:hypothetical protein
MGAIKANNYSSGRPLRFYDASTHETVDMVSHTYLYDDFIGVAADVTNDWNSSIVNSSTFLVVAGATGGVGRITTGVVDDNDHDVATPLVFKAANACCMEARIATADVAHTAMYIGFSDAITTAGNLIPMTYATTTLTTTAANGAGFFTDSDATTNRLMACTVKANVDGTLIEAGVIPVDTVYHIYRVEIDADGNVYFYYDGALVGTQLLGITTSTALCAIVSLINREGSANTLDIDYIRVWQKRV